MNGKTTWSGSEKLNHMFVGREGQLRQLWEGFDGLRQQRGSVLFLTGNSGVGKTALVTEFLRQIGERSDALVLTATCNRQESGPYHAVEQWVDSLCQYLLTLSNEPLSTLLPSNSNALASLFPAASPLTPLPRAERSESEVYKKETRWDAFHALSVLLTGISRLKPLVLVMDDLQWADADNLDALRSIVRYGNQTTALFIGCCRSDDLKSLESLRSLADSCGDVDRISLDSLSEEESYRLALSLISGQIVETDAPKLALAIARESLGIPIYLRELVYGSVRSKSSSDEPKLSVERMLWNRIQRLPESMRFLLYALCVAGRPLPREMALALAQSQEPCPLHILRDECLIQDDDSGEQHRVAIYHDRICDVVLPRIGQEVHTECRLRLAELGETHMPQEVEFLATQFRCSNQPDKAAEYYVLAADRALERLAFHQAANFYAEAMKLKAFPPVKRTALRAAMAESLSSAGHGVEAAKEYLRLADTLSGAARLDVRRQAFTQYLQIGRIHEGVSILKDVLDELGMTIPRTSRGAIIQIQLTRLQLRLRGLRFRLIEEDKIPPADLLYIDVLWSVAVCLRRIDLIRGVAFAARSCLEAIRVGEPNRIARGLALEGMHLAVPGARSSVRAEKLIETAKRLVADTDDRRVRTQVTMCEGITAALLGRWKLCLLRSEHAEEGFRTNEVGEVTTSRFWQMFALVWLGRLAELQQRCTTLVDSAEERGDLYEIVNIGTYTLAVARLAQDRPRDAWDEVSSIMDRWTQEEFQVQHHLELVAKVSVLLYEGNHREAAELLGNSWSQHKQSLMWGAHLVRANLLHLQVRIALKSLDEGSNRARELRDARQGIQALQQENLPWTTALAMVGEASLEQLVGNLEIAKQKYEQAAKRFDELDMEIYAAVSRRRLGQILRGDRGRELVDRADHQMRAQQIVAPVKMAEFLVPGPIAESD